MRLLALFQVVSSRTLSPWIAGLVVTLSLALGPSPARAVPIQYTALPGASVDVAVYKGVGSLFPIGIQTIALELTSTITIDSETETLLGFDFLLVPGAVLNLSESYGGFDEITLDEVVVASNEDFETYSEAFDLTGYTFLASGITVEAEYTAVDSSSTNPSQSGQSITFPTNLNGAYVWTPAELSFSGVQLALISGTPFGETDLLLVLGSFSMTGGSPTVIPEPSTGALLGLGLLLLGARRRAKSGRA